MTAQFKTELTQKSSDDEMQKAGLKPSLKSNLTLNAGVCDPIKKLLILCPHHTLQIRPACKILK